jgi:hypothetical protein
MADHAFTTTFTVDRTPTEAFAAITNVRGWWSEEIDGRTDQLGAEFAHHYEDVHRCRIRVTELVPGRKVSVHRVGLLRQRQPAELDHHLVTGGRSPASLLNASAWN